MSQFFGDHCCQMLVQFLLRTILGKFQPIETGIGAWIWIPLFLLNLLNRKFIDSIAIAFEIPETKNGHSGTTSAIMKQIGELFLIIFLNNLPKPNCSLVGGCITSIAGVLLPVIHIDELWPINHHL